MRPASLIPVLLLLLTACGGEQQPGAAVAAEAVAEVPAGDGAYEWPDGATATVIAVTASPARGQSENPADDTRVEVVVEFGNTGAEMVAFGPAPNTIDAGPPVDLLYGANRTEAQGWFVDNNLPTQLTPGTTARWVAEFTAPGDELGTMAVTVAPTLGHQPVTFTGVETLVSD